MQVTRWSSSSGRGPPLMMQLIFTCAILLLTCKSARALGCFKCESYNGSQPLCEDPFNNTAVPKGYYIKICHAPRPGRSGFFPATQCLKVKLYDPKENIMKLVRTCVVDNGGNNDDSEIGRSNHCGVLMQDIYLQPNEKDKKYKANGCILSCKSDGCNSAIELYSSHFLTMFLTCVTFLVSFHFH